MIALQNKLVKRIKYIITQEESLILQQILPFTFIGNVEGQQMRIWILILEFNGLMCASTNYPYPPFERSVEIPRGRGGI